MMDNYDVQQICLNGHQITDEYNRCPEERKDVCDICGAKTLHTCPNCGEIIRGAYYQSPFINTAIRKRVLSNPNFVSSFSKKKKTPLPKHCHKCGTPYPWALKVD